MRIIANASNIILASKSGPPDLRRLVAQQARQMAMLTELAHIAATPQAEAVLLTAAALSLATTGGYATLEIFAP